MASKNNSTATAAETVQKQSAVETSATNKPTTPAAPAVITSVKHHSEMSDAYSLGACCIDRMSTMIDAARAIAMGPTAPAVSTYMLTKFLEECRCLSADLGGMLESERDSQLQYAADKGVK